MPSIVVSSCVSSHDYAKMEDCISKLKYPVSISAFTNAALRFFVALGPDECFSILRSRKPELLAQKCAELLSEATQQE